METKIINDIVYLKYYNINNFYHCQNALYIEQNFGRLTTENNKYYFSNGTYLFLASGRIILRENNSFKILYLKSGDIHRADGPAEIYISNYNFFLMRIYYYNGEVYNKNKFFEILSPEEKNIYLFNVENFIDDADDIKNFYTEILSANILNIK